VCIVLAAFLSSNEKTKYGLYMVYAKKNFLDKFSLAWPVLSVKVQDGT